MQMTDQVGHGSTPLVSVVIPTRDRPISLVAAIRSVLRQTYAHLEILVVDDGSETPVRLLEDLAGGERNVSLIRLESSLGPAEARNRAIARCKGSLVAFLDDDDEWFDTKIELQVDQLMREGDTVAMSRCGYEMWSEGTLELTHVPSYGHDLRAEVLKGPTIAPSTVLIRRSVLDELGGFDPSLQQMEDWDLFLRLSDRYTGVSLPIILVKRSRHEPVAPDLLFRYYGQVAGRVRERTKGLPAGKRIAVNARHTWWMGLRRAENGIRRFLGRRAWLLGIAVRRRLRRGRAEPVAPSTTAVSMPASGHRLKICHVITDLDLAGSQLVLRRLLEGMNKDRFDNHVVVLKRPGVVAEELEKLGIPVSHLRMSSSIGPSNVLSAVVRLRRWIAEERPDVVQTWMYHADLVGSLATIGRRRPALLWNIRHTDLLPQASRRSTRWVALLNARLSTLLPDRIVCNGYSAAEVHIRQGYPRARIEVIHNGFVVPDVHPEARAAMLEQIGLPEDAVLIGRAARFHALKDFSNLVRAATKVIASTPNAHFILCGAGIGWDASPLVRLIDGEGLRKHFHLLGPLYDMPRFYAALDLAVSSSSFGEAFPNVVAEAMLAGVPVVATDVGETTLIVGETGEVIPPHDHAALADAIDRILSLPAPERAQLGMDAHERIRTMFPYQKMIDSYEALYEDVYASHVVSADG